MPALQPPTPSPPPCFSSGPRPRPLPPPPPPPPPRCGGLPQIPSTTLTTDWGALKDGITKGVKLRKAVTPDRSSPAADGNASGSSSFCLGEKLKAPPSSGAASYRVRSAGDVPGNGPSSGGIPPAASQLAGLFSGKIPKLRSRGGVDTGASRPSSYISPSDSSTISTALVLPAIPLASYTPAARPATPSTSSSPPFVRRLAPPVPANRPTSAALLRTALSPPPPPPPPLSSASLESPSKPLQKTSAPLPRAKSHSPPLKKPPSILRANHPPPPPPPPTPANTQSPPMSPALVAARKATGYPTTGPLGGTLPQSPLAPPSRPPPTPRNSSVSSYKDSGSFTLETTGKRSASGRVVVDDSRWKFKREEDLPEPRVWKGDRKVYRSGGVGSTIPLDLRLLD